MEGHCDSEPLLLPIWIGRSLTKVLLINVDKLSRELGTRKRASVERHVNAKLGHESPESFAYPSKSQRKQIYAYNSNDAEELHAINITPESCKYKDIDVRCPLLSLYALTERHTA